MAMFHRAVLGFVITCVVLVAVRATASEQMKVPLLEVGTLWFRALQDFGSSIKNGIMQVPYQYDDPWMYVKLICITAITYFLYWLFFVPLDRVRRLGDLGYVTEGKGMTQKDMANLVQKRRMVGGVPPVYPNGWFAVLESRDLKVGEAKPVSVLGKFLSLSHMIYVFWSSFDMFKHW